MEPGVLKRLISGRQSGLMEIKKHSAVLILLVERDGRLCFLFERRSSGISQPGEVCFPGGRMEEGETPKQAAVRELGEELGLGPQSLLFAEEFDTLVLYANIAVHTVFAWLKEEALEDIRPSEAEVAEWFTVPADWLREHEPYVYEYRVVPEIREDFPYDMVDSSDKYNWRTGRCTVPIWTYEGRSLWGMTARIVLRALSFLEGAGAFS